MSEGTNGLTFNQQGLIDKLISAVPSWAIGCIGTILALALVLRIIGIDFAGPINSVSEAYTSAIIAQQQGMEAFSDATKRLDSLIQEEKRSRDEMNRRVERTFVELEGEIASFRVMVSEFDDVHLIFEDRLERLEEKVSKMEFTPNTNSEDGPGTIRQ